MVHGFDERSGVALSNFFSVGKARVTKLCHTVARALVELFIHLAVFFVQRQDPLRRSVVSLSGE